MFVKLKIFFEQIWNNNYIYHLGIDQTYGRVSIFEMQKRRFVINSKNLRWCNIIIQINACELSENI